MNGTKCDTNKSAGRLMRPTSANRGSAPSSSPSASQQESAVNAQASEPATHIKCEPPPPSSQQRLLDGQLLLRSIQYQPLDSSSTDHQLSLKLEFRTLDNERELQRFKVAARRRKWAQHSGQLDEFQVEVSKWIESVAAAESNQSGKRTTTPISFRARLKSASRKEPLASSAQEASEVALYLSPSKSLSERSRRRDVSTSHNSSELRLKFCHFKVGNNPCVGGACGNQLPSDGLIERPPSGASRLASASEQRATRLLVEESPRRRAPKGGHQEGAAAAAAAAAAAGNQEKALESSVLGCAQRRVSSCCCSCCCCCCCDCCGRASSSLAPEGASSLAAAICLAHFYSAAQVARGQLMSERHYSSGSSTSSANCESPIVAPPPPPPLSCLSNSRSCSCSLASEPNTPTTTTTTQPTFTSELDKKRQPAACQLKGQRAKRQSGQQERLSAQEADEGASTSCFSSAPTLANPNSGAGSSACGSSCGSSPCSPLAPSSSSAAAALVERRRSRHRSRRHQQHTNRRAQIRTRSKSGEPERQLLKRFDYSPPPPPAIDDRISISASCSSSSSSTSSSSLSSSSTSSCTQAASLRAANPNALAVVSAARKDSRQWRAVERRKAERARKYAKRERQDGDKSMTTAHPNSVSMASSSCGPGASWTAPTTSGSEAAVAGAAPLQSGRLLTDCSLPSASELGCNLRPSSEHTADSSNIQQANRMAALMRPASKPDSTLETSDIKQLPSEALKRVERVTHAPLATINKRQHVAERPSQVDPKNLLNPMDLVFARATSPHDHRAHSFTAASLTTDSDSLVAQLAASARSRSLCTENDRQMDAHRFQQRRLDAAVKRVGDFGRRMSRMTRKAIDRLKVISSSNPNLGPIEAGADCGGGQPLKPGGLRRGRFNSQRVKGPTKTTTTTTSTSTKRRAGNYEIELLVPGEQAPEDNLGGGAGKRSGLFARRWGSQAAPTRDLKSASTLSLRMSQDEQLLYAPGGVYMGTGERCNLLELAQAGGSERAPVSESQRGRSAASSSRTNSISWLTRPLMRSSVAHALLGATNLAGSIERPDSDCVTETAAPASSTTPARRPDCASVSPCNVDNDQLRWNNNESKGQLVVIRVGSASESGQRQQQRGHHDAVPAGALNLRASSGAVIASQVGLQIMKCDDQIRHSDTSGPNSSATRHCLASTELKGTTSSSTIGPPAASSAACSRPLGKQQERIEQGEQEERATDERLASAKTTNDVSVAPASRVVNSATNLNRKQSLSAEFDFAIQVGGQQQQQQQQQQPLSNMSHISSVSALHSTPATASKRWLLNLTHRGANSNDKSNATGCKQQAPFRKQRERAAKIRSSSPPAHFSEENRSNSLTSGELPDNERRLLSQLSRSSCAVNLCVAELAEQTSLYLAQLNDRFSSSSHELTLTPPNSANVASNQHHNHHHQQQQQQQHQHSTLWFRRSNSRIQAEVATHQAANWTSETHQASAMQEVGNSEQNNKEQAGQQTGSPMAATELYGANLQTTCIHCQLIAELSSHPESAYLSQLLATEVLKPQLPVSNCQSEEAPVAASVQIEPASDELEHRQEMRGPSLVLTACSNQGTFDDDDAASSAGQSRRQSAGSTAILINLDGSSTTTTATTSTSTTETTGDEQSASVSRRSSGSSMSAPNSQAAGLAGFQPLVEAPEDKTPADSDSERDEDADDNDDEPDDGSSASSGSENTSSGELESSGGAQSSSVSHKASRRTQPTDIQGEGGKRATEVEAEVEVGVEAVSSNRLKNCDETGRRAMNSSSSSSGSSRTASSSSNASSLDSSSESRRTSHSQDDSKLLATRRRRKKKKKKKNVNKKKRSVEMEATGAGLNEAAAPMMPINERVGAPKELVGKMNTLEVPLGALAASKQMRSNSLDTHYLLNNKPNERVGALSMSSSQNQSRELIDSDYEDYAADDDFSKASSTTAGGGATVAMALAEPNSPVSSSLTVPVNKSARSRSVDISLPTQPGESYSVRETESPSGRSTLQQKQKQQQASQLKAAKVAAAEKKSARGKRFIQGEIKVPYANGETRPLKLFVDWDENCVNGEHLWLYQGSSSEACYVGESECLKHGPRLSCSACKITAHTGCIGILTDKIKFICKHTFKDLTVNNPRHLKELHQNVIYHHWVHKRTHCGRCKQCTKTIGNTKLPFSSKEIQAITCSWCKVSYHNKENCYTLSTLTEPCSLGAHRESIIPPSWIVKLPNQANTKSDGDDRNQLSDICDLNQRQQQHNSKLIELSLSQTLNEQNCEFNNNEPKENLAPFRIRHQQHQQQSLGVNQQRYGSSATLITDTSGYMSADGCNSGAPIGALHNIDGANNCEILMDPSALHAADLSLINQAQGERLSEQALLENQQDQPGAVDQNSMQPDCDMMSSSYSLFEPSQPSQQMMPKAQAEANIFKNFKIIPQSIPGIPNAGSKPVLVFVNPRSGGNQGAKMMQKFNWLLNPRQVFDLIQSSGPRAALELYRDVPNLRILTIGGDGTASWILSHLDDIGASNRIPVAVLPLGTGNDLARALGWGGGYADEPIAKILAQVRDGEVVQLDRWNLHVERNHEATPSSPNEFSTTSGANMDFSLSPSITSSPSSNYGATSNTNTISSTISMLDQATNCDTNAIPSSVLDEAGNDRLPMDVINNYFSFGVDAHIALEFHTAREAHPERFNSRLRNKMFYGQAGGKDLLKRKWKDLSNFVTLYCDGQDMTSRLKELKVHSVLFLNIPSYGGGTRPWPTTATAFAKPRTDDGLIEVIGLTTYQLPLLQAGGHGTCIAQCRNAKIITSRTIPMQVDGEPCKLLPSIITISFKNRVCMLSKSKTSGHPQKLN